MNRIAIIVYSLILVLTSCANPKDLVYQNVENFKVRSVGFSKTEIGADIRFYNPNNYAMTLRNVNADVFVNNKFMGKVKVDSTLNVPRRNTFSVPVTLNADMGGVLGNLVQALTSKEVLLKLTGSAQAGRNGIFVNVPINYQGKQKLNADF